MKILMQDRIFPEEDLLPLRVLADLLYCERRAVLHQVERLWEDNPFTVEGVHVHQRVDREMKTEVRGGRRVARGLMIHSLHLGLIGKADVVEFQRIERGTLAANGVPLAGAKGLWRPVPIEYKRGSTRHEAGYEVQLCAQGLCLEEMLHVTIPAGEMFFEESHRRMEIPFDDNLRQRTKDAAAKLHRLIALTEPPPPVHGPKCRRCSLSNICLPRVLSRKHSVQDYLRKAIDAVKDET